MRGRSFVSMCRLAGESRRALRAFGPDAERFIQGTISGDVTQSRQRAVCAAMLTVKGKVVNDLVVVGDSRGLWLWLPAEEIDGAHARLDRHVIMDEVSFEQPEELEAVLVLDPEWSIPAVTEASSLVVLPCEYPGVGVWVQGERAAILAVVDGMEELSYDAWTQHRAEHGYPAWSKEIVPDVFPPEVGFVAAVSYDKGCFMGQEPLARIHARGQVNRVMVRVEVAGDEQILDVMPAPLRHESRKDAGRLTTLAAARAVDAPRCGLAVVRRSLACIGTTLHTNEGVEVTVRSEALGDDDGI